MVNLDIKMESLSASSTEPRTVQKYQYYVLLTLCLLIGVAICCSVLPVLPPVQGQNEINHGHITFAITRDIFLVVIIIVEIIFYRVIRSKDAFHRKQEIFWPLQCRHCARAVGILPQKKSQVRFDEMVAYGKGKQNPKRSQSFSGAISSERSQDMSKDCLKLESTVGSMENCSPKSQEESTHGNHPHIVRNDTLCKVKCDKSFNGSSLTKASFTRGVNLYERRGNSESVFQGMEDDATKPSNNRLLYKKPHKSLLNIFLIFSIIGLCNIPLQLIGIGQCFFQNDNSPSLAFSLLSQGLLDIAYIILILEAWLFFSLYYDAVFIDRAKFYYSIVIVVACCVWLAVLKILFPLSELTESPYGKIEYPCKLSGTFGAFLSNTDKMLTPFYAECGIIACGIMCQLWSALLPQSCLFLSHNVPDFEIIEISPTEPFLKRVFRNAKRFCQKSAVSSQSERQKLLPTVNIQPSRSSIYLTVIVSIVIGIVYLVLCLFIQYYESKQISEDTKIYIHMCCEITFNLPAIAMYRYQNFLTDSFSSFRLKMRISYLRDLVESHDRILLLSCVGIFTLNIFRLMASIGLLFKANSLHPDELCLACFTLVFAIFRMYTLWMMTTFLFIVQRQNLRGKLAIEWTLVCLVYTIVLSSTQWLYDSINIDTWIELKNYFGDTPGEVMGILLEPITSLYGIHSAMVAMEAYKSIVCEKYTNPPSSSK